MISIPSTRGLARDLAVSRYWYELRTEPQLRPETYRRLKRLLDLTVALAVLPVAAFLIAICIVAIKLDSPGKALFVQQRTGRGGRRLGMVAGGTMVDITEGL